MAKRPRSPGAGAPSGETAASPGETEAAAVWGEFSLMSQRMAFYAGAWKRGRFTIPLEEARDYGRLLPAAIELERRRLEEGGAPRKLTPEVVRGLAAGRRPE